jgi:radical SAM protein with 4Fe4S-binding SPASM domain
MSDLQTKIKNDNLCIIPWVHLHTWPNGNVYPCCITPIENTVGNLNENTLTEIYNSDEMKKLRLQMLNNERPESCQRCYVQEDCGAYSFRKSANRDFNAHTDLIYATNEDGSVDNPKLTYWDFRFSNVCNFKCRSCGPQLSTGWYNDSKKISEIETGRKFLPDNVPGEITFDLWEQIQPYFNDVETIYFAGGEPLIMEEHYRILKKLDEIGKHDVSIRYNTNFSEMRYKDLYVLDHWKKFSNITVGASLDGMGEQGELIRSGFSWDQCVDNRKKMMDKCPHVDFYVNCTVSVQNAFHCIDFHKKLVDMGLIWGLDKFHVNPVMEPPYLSLQILPPDMKKTLTELYTEHAEMLESEGCHSVANDFHSLVTYMNSENKQKLIDTFLVKMSTLDIIRGEKFFRVFPELEVLRG